MLTDVLTIVGFAIWVWCGQLSIVRILDDKVNNTKIHVDTIPILTILGPISLLLQWRLCK